MADHEHEGMKKCTKCGEWKPATAEFFCRNKAMTDGMNSWCKECKHKYREENKEKIAEWKRKYREENKEKIAGYGREYRHKNKDRIREYNREYRQKNNDWFREYEREYRREHRQTPVGKLVNSIKWLREKTGATIYVRDMTEEQKEVLANQLIAIQTLEKTERELLAASGKKRCLACDRILDYEMFYKNCNGQYRSWCKACDEKYNRKYHQQNKDKINEQNREYYQQNKDKLNEYNREYRQKNRDRLLEHKREYYEKNKDKINERRRKYRQNKKKQKST